MRTRAISGIGEDHLELTAAEREGDVFSPLSGLGHDGAARADLHHALAGRDPLVHLLHAEKPSPFSRSIRIPMSCVAITPPRGPKIALLA